MPTALRFIPVAVQPKGMTQSHSQDVLSPTQAPRNGGGTWPARHTNSQHPARSESLFLRSCCRLW